MGLRSIANIFLRYSIDVRLTIIEIIGCFTLPDRSTLPDFTLYHFSDNFSPAPTLSIQIDRCAYVNVKPLPKTS